MPRLVTRRAGRLGTGLAACLLAVSIVPLVSAAPAPSVAVRTALAAPSDTACLDEQEIAFLGRINDYRQQNGLGLLQASATLTDAADAHSRDMATTGVFDHTMSDGTTVGQNIEQNGYTGTTYGENIAAGIESADEALSTWQNSAEHNANMLRGAFGAIGIARSYNADSQYGWYWTTTFGGTFDKPAQVCGEEASGTASEAQLANGSPYRIVTADTTLLGGPEPGFEALASVPSGSIVEVTGDENAGYLPVVLGEQRGWVDAATLQQATTATATDDVNFRAGPSYDDAVLTVIPTGSVVALDGNVANGFLGASFNGQEGWIDQQYLDDSAATTTAETASAAGTIAAQQPAAPSVAAIDPAAGTATAMASTPLRAGPAATESSIGSIADGSEVTLTGRSGGGFLEVSVDGRTGWVDAAYLR